MLGTMMPTEDAASCSTREAVQETARIILAAVAHHSLTAPVTSMTKASAHDRATALLASNPSGFQRGFRHVFVGALQPCEG